MKHEDLEALLDAAERELENFETAFRATKGYLTPGQRKGYPERVRHLVKRIDRIRELTESAG
jgi:hypothetical protein